MSIPIEGGPSFISRAGEALAAKEPPSPRVAPGPEPSSFEQLLRGLGRRVDQGEGVIRGVSSGAWQSSDPGTLIAVQASIYRYSEAVDLVGKLIDRAGNGVRTVLQAGH